MNFLVALRKEVLEQWRSYRLLIIAAVLVVFGLLSPLLAKLTPEIIRMVPGGEDIAMLIPPPGIQDAVAQYVKNVSQFGVVLALLMTMGAVAQEKERGTAALMLVKPVPRGTFLAAKLTALTLSFTASIALAGIAAYYYTLILFEPLDLPSWLALNGLMLLFLLVYVSLTLLASTLTSSQAVAGGIAFAVMVALSILGAIPRLGEFLPGQLLNWGALLVLGETGSFWPAVGISVGLIAGAFAVAWAAFERQEL
ncbi:MAG: ABC transporter permease subunit [Anaerolineae bacterium]|nr:ABC transporter permease subunit [Anaerolineae bacterium]